MTRKWRGTALFAVIMAAISVTVAGRLLTGGGATAQGSATASGGAATAAAGAGAAAVTGKTEQTRFGPVQVSVTFSGTRIVAVKTLQAPAESGRDEMLTQLATPQLEQEVIASQSAHVDTVSGATYTSEGYLASVQSAIDAHS